MIEIYLIVAIVACFTLAVLVVCWNGSLDRWEITLRKRRRGGQIR